MLRGTAAAVVALCLVAGSSASGQSVNAFSTPFLADGLSTTVKTVKASPGSMQWWSCSNPSAAVAFIQVFDTTAAVTLGTTVPKYTIAVQATSSQNGRLGINHLVGIKLAATTTPKGSSAPASALDCSFAFQ
jgi:hypothetical protein